MSNSFDCADIDSLCDSFEAAWNAGEPPVLEEFLQRAPETVRRDLLSELLQVELWRRRQETPAPSIAEYRQRYPEFADVVDDAFEKLDHLAASPDDTAASEPTLDTPREFAAGVAETAVAINHRPSADGNLNTPSRSRYFADYELLKEIARGGMGVVFQARQLKLNRIVALKMILSGQLAGDEEVQRFQTEAEAAANLDHPGIVPIYEIGEHAGQHYFSMGFVDGQSVQDKLRDGPLEPREAAELCLKVTVAVGYAHEKGVIHRDLKPANVLLDRNGEPRVTDFGLAKQVESDSDLTRTGAVMGTPSFMPPEQASGKTDDVGPAADVYSLGAILYCLLTGHPPFQAATALDTLRQVIERDPIAPSTLNPKVPNDLETICLKCLEKGPLRRYESANELAAELERYLAGQPILARPISRRERAWRWCKCNPLVAGLCATVLLLLTAGIIVSSSFAIAANKNAQLASTRATELATTLRRAQDSEKLAAEKAEDAVRSLVIALTFAPPDRVAQSIAALEPFREQTIPMLHEHFLKTVGAEKLHIAFALANFSEPVSDYLVDQIVVAPVDQSRNLLTSLHTDRDGNAKRVLQVFLKSRPAATAEETARLAAAALDLGVLEPVIEILQLKTDPHPRSEFIDCFHQWHTNLKECESLLDSTIDDDVRYGLCLALGTIAHDDIPSEDQERLAASLVRVHEENPDGGVHRAAEWTLRRWQVNTSDSGMRFQSRSSAGWEINRVGITMVRIPAGQFLRSDGGSASSVKIGSRVLAEKPQTVTITNDFFMSSHEVALKQFRQFTKETGFLERSDSTNSQTASQITPENFPHQNADAGRDSDDLPVQDISWISAAAFCNWLSKTEGLDRVYRKDEAGEFRTDHGASGYRLPTEAEWEYAARAGTSTIYSFGDRTEHLGRYAAPLKGDLFAAGSFMPNRWGLQDMYGNVAEWCNDFDGRYGTSSVKDPRGPKTGSRRIVRGGSIRDSAGVLCSSSRHREKETYRSVYLGFRVVRPVPMSAE